MALSKLKTYKLNEELLKIIKKELEEKTDFIECRIQQLAKMINLRDKGME